MSFDRVKMDRSFGREIANRRDRPRDGESRRPARQAITAEGARIAEGLALVEAEGVTEIRGAT